MIKRLTCFLVSFLLIFGSFGVSARAEGSVNDQEIENNDTMETAQSINFGTNLTGEVVSYGDVDYYKFDTMTQCKISYNFSNESYGLTVSGGTNTVV